MPSARAQTSRPQRRRPGRPPGGDDAVRQRLLETARQLFLTRGFGSVSLRQVAAEAGTTPAMIHYYFGDKRGLYREMLGAVAAPLIEALQAPPPAMPVDGSPVEAFLRRYMDLVASNPWMPALIVQEVLTGGGQFREEFIEHFAGRVAPLFVEALRREQSAGRLRADLDPSLAAVSAISLAVFPMIARPVTRSVLGVDAAGADRARFVTHTLRLLFEGVAAREAP